MQRVKWVLRDVLPRSLRDRVMRWVLERRYDARVGLGARIKGGTKVKGDVRIGRGTVINDRCDLIGPLEVGRYCAIARETILQGRNHDATGPSLQVRMHRELLGGHPGVETKGGIHVGHDVWLGTRAILLPGVTLGHGSVVGAGAVVTKDVAPYEVVGGVPAGHLRWRFPEQLREKLLEIAWWEWEPQRIARNARFFETDLTALEDPADLDDLIT